LVPADADHRKRANGFIDDFKPIGGTAIADAMQSALKVRPDKSDRPFVVIFLTDGLPTVGTRNPDEIVANIKKASGVRIFSFGIGSDVNTQLLDQIAEGTRAFSQYVLANEDLELKVSNFYTRIKEPALTNVKLDLGGGVRTSKMYPADLPDLFKGDQLVVAFTYKLHFDDRKTTEDYVPRLWATRRVGFLLDEIRIHGETSELRDETTELARKYGIVTPYTAYLIVEDEDRRRVPMADRSMQSMSADATTRGEVAKAWTAFKDKKDGEDGVANARSQNAFKFAQQAPASIASGASESLRGFAAAAPAGTPAAARLGQYTQQSKFVNGRAFFQNGNQWIDSNAQNTSKRQRIQFNSEEYFNLLTKHPEAGPWLALGQNVVLTLDDTVYEIAE
jgi:Ca-activated chloride channel family protein